MSRLRRIADRDRIFFITTNLARGVPELVATERDLVLDQLARQHSDRDFYLFAYAVMPTHLHLLLAPERLGLIAIMYRLKRFTAQRIAARRGKKGTIWQTRYFDFALRRARDFWDKREYIHNNPVEANLTRLAKGWRWSSAAAHGNPASSRLRIDQVDLPADHNAPLYPAPWR